MKIQPLNQLAHQPQNPRPDARELLPISSICTASRLPEFLVTKATVEQFHRCRWVAAVDAQSYTFLKAQFPEDHWLLLLDEEGSHIKAQYDAFMKVVLHKMIMMRECIMRYGWTVFLDSDLVFTAPIDFSDFWKAPVTVSDHHVASERVVEQYGRYNVGFIGCSDIQILNEWEYQTRLGQGNTQLEQKPFEQTLLRTGIPFSVLPERYNIGWWRGSHDPHYFNRLSVQQGNEIVLGDAPAVNFHLHIDPSIQRNQERVFSQLITRCLASSKRSEHQHTLSMIQAVINESASKNAATSNGEANATV